MAAVPCKAWLNTEELEETFPCFKDENELAVLGAILDEDTLAC